MLLHNISIDQSKYCAVKHRKTAEFYAVLLKDWEHKAIQMSSMDEGKEITCYKLSFDTPTNCFRLTNNTIKINSSELSGMPT